MPVATRKFSEHEFQLNSLEGGWVKIKRLSYGETQDRSSVLAAYSQPTATAQGRNRTEQRRMKRLGVDIPEEANEQVLRIQLRALRAYEFAHCVTDHNLTDELNNKLDFTLQGVLEILDPDVAEEIADLIAEVNDNEGDVDAVDPTHSEPIKSLMAEQ